jgi:Putative peptidoglycan binding domain
MDLRTECVDLRQGAQGQCTLSLQHLLIQYGAPLPNTGTYGPLTADAVSGFQRKHGLPDTGTAGPATKEALYANLTTLTATPVLPGATVYCPGRECSVYLSRATTASIANALDKHTILPLATFVVAQLACRQLSMKGFQVFCNKTVYLLANYVITQFRDARYHHECVRVGFAQLASGDYTPVAVARSAGLHCSD